jgi:hypothetical protein
MQVLFKPRHPHAADLRDLTERRVRFVLRRLRWMVPRAEVQLSDVNGPRGGVDKRCRVELRTDGAGSVVVTSQWPATGARRWTTRWRAPRASWCGCGGVAATPAACASACSATNVDGRSPPSMARQALARAQR